MDVNFSPKKIQNITNNAEKLPETKQEDASVQQQDSTPTIIPDSAVLRAYAGIIEPKKTVSKEDIINCLKENRVLNEKLYDTVIEALTEKDGTISLSALNSLKQFLPKIYIQQTASVLNNAKENGTFNKQVLQLADSLMPKRPDIYGAQINISDILRNLKDKDGSFNQEALNMFLKHNEKIVPILKRRADLVFSAIKNKNNEFCPAAIKYLNNNLNNEKQAATLLNDLFSGKDKDGNFNINILELNNYLNKTFERYQIPTIKSVISVFNQEQTKEREDFFKFAKSIRKEHDFDKIITFIQENKSYDKSGLNYNKESAEFAKNLIDIANNSNELASTVYKNLGIPPEEYTDELLKAIKTLCIQAPKDTEMFLNASKNKTGEQKGKLNLEALYKYIDLNYNTIYIAHDAVKSIIPYLSLEKDFKTLDIVEKLYSLEFSKNRFSNEILNPNLINLALKILCDYDTQNNCPRQKCNPKALDKIEELLNNDALCESKEDFTKKFKEIINNTVKAQFFKNKNINIINVFQNKNIDTILEIESGKRETPTTTFYDLAKGKIIAVTEETKDGIWVIQTQKDFINNTQTDTVYERIPIGTPYSQTTTKYDNDGNILYKETITESPIKNLFNVVKTYPDGHEEKICNAYKSPNGNEVIEKHMTSLDGTKTDYRYEDDVTGNRIIDYKITDKNGKVLMNNSVTFEVVDENHFISSNNNKKFDIQFNGNNLNVKNLQTGETAVIKLDRFTKYTQDKLLPVLKSFPGEELFAMKTLDLQAFSVDESVENACFNNRSKEIKTKERYIDLSVLLHEMGHAKDRLSFSEINTEINKDEKLREIYEEERNTFRKNFGDSQLSFIDYFCADEHYLGKEHSIEEGIAETNALLSAYPKNNIQAMRSLYWQQYFPRTIAYLSGLLN